MRPWVRHLLLLVPLALGACTTVYTPVTPESLGDRSLVLGRIAAIDWRGHAERPAETADLRIDGLRYRNVVRNGWFVVALGPGRHKIDALVMDRDGETLTRPLNRRVDVSAGRDLNAGLMILWFGSNRDGNRYSLLVLDNRAEMMAHVRHAYPRLWSVVAGRTLDSPGPGTLNRSGVRLLREEIVKRLVSHDRRMWPRVAGPVGTVALLRPARGKRTAQITMFDARTLGDFRNCGRSGGELICSLDQSDGRARLLVFDGHNLVYRELPAGCVPRGLFLSRDHTLYVVDGLMRILVLPPRAKRWKSYVGAMRDHPLLPSEAINFRQSAEGIYISISGRDGSILFRDRMTGRYSHIDNPGPAVYMWNVVQVTGGIVTGGTVVGGQGGDYLFFRPASGTSWERRKIPARSCLPRLIPQEEGGSVRSIGVQCGRRLYVTHDIGVNWQRRGE